MEGTTISATLDQPAAAFHDRGLQSDQSIAEQFGLVTNQPRVAVLIPCRNEEAAIGKVVSDFQNALPEATIYVYDNNSTDHTMLEARAAGAVVRRERLQGKGHVVRRMFADIDADVYLLVDGDDTYDADAAPGMLSILIERQLDMVNAARYGAFSSPDGQVRVQWRVAADGNSLRLSWRESGGPAIAAPGPKSFGLRLVEMGLAREISGAVELAFAPEGLTCSWEMTLP